MRRAPLALAALAVVGLTLTAASCGPSTDGISTGEVTRATVVELVDVPASVTAKAVATLSAPADGTLAALPVAPGDTVAKDQVLAVIDSPGAQKRLADAQAALDAASQVGGGIGYVNLSTVQSGLDVAANDAFSAARMAADKISDAELKAALLAQVDMAEKHYAAAADTARQLQRQVQSGIAGIGEAVSALGAAQQAQAQSAVDLAQSTVDALTIRAPIAGIVQFARPATAGTTDPLSTLLGQVTGGAASGSASGSTGATVGVDDIVAVGDQLGAGSAVVTIVDISEIGLVGDVDETDVLLVSPGVLAEVELDASPGLTFEATVGTVDLLPTPSTRGGVAYRIRMSFRAVNPGNSDEPGPTPRPGMSAVAHLRVRTAVDAVSVPAAAVFTADGGDAVWLLRDGAAVRQTVRVGVQGFGAGGEDLVQITNGVSPGDRVVISGADKVTAGQDLS